MTTPNIRVGDRVRVDHAPIEGEVTRVWPDTYGNPPIYVVTLADGTKHEAWEGEDCTITILDRQQPGDGAVILLAEGVAAQRHGDVWRVVNGAEYGWAEILKHHAPVKVVTDGE
jgi:hypothetical protein